MKISTVIRGFPAFAAMTLAAPLPDAHCEQTDILILGAGAAGVAAGKQLADLNITNFIILEYNSEIGGRVRHASFGQKADRSGSYTIEQGANWIHEAGNSSSGVVNPIWALAEKYGLKRTLADAGDIAYYNESGRTDLSNEYARMEEALNTADGFPGSYRAALRKAGWNPERDPKAQAVESFIFDLNYAASPDVVDTNWGDAEGTEPQPQYGDHDDFIVDERGYNYILHQELNSSIGPNSTKLHLNTIVSEISVRDDSVIVRTANGKCFSARYAISTFSIGVLQNAALGKSRAPVSFNPPLPEWKQNAIASFGIGIYSKIFLQFSHAFWTPNIENLIYASPTSRGYYGTWQSLNLPSSLPGSNIIFATVSTGQSERIEAQTDAETKAEALEVLGEMFGKDNVTNSEVLDFFYPRWGRMPWAYGSYSYWPVGYTSEQYQDLKRNVGRLWFAGEAYAASREATVDGAWSSGLEVAREVAGCLRENGERCSGKAVV